MPNHSCNIIHRGWVIVSLAVGFIFLFIGTAIHFGFPSIIGFIISNIPLLVYATIYSSGAIQSTKSAFLINVVLALTYALLLFIVAVVVFFHRTADNSTADSESNLILSIAAMIYLCSVGLYFYFMMKAFGYNKELKKRI